jgi:putative N6-adenine-specific DNA methylase
MFDQNMLSQLQDVTGFMSTANNQPLFSKTQPQASEAPTSTANDLTIYVTTSFGMEAIASRELQNLGYTDIKTETGNLRFQGDLLAVCRCNLWLRTAERVFIEVGRFPAEDFGVLFDGTTELPWEKYIPEKAEVPVLARSVRSQLTSTPHIQSIVKKAIVSRLLKKYGGTFFDESGPMHRVECVLQNNEVQLLLDTSGDGLHKRGYRAHAGAAPLKETMAAGMVMLSYWDRDRLLVDPFCGSGTILIEAALIGRNMAPGAFRAFAAEYWPLIPRTLWHQARQEVRDKALSRIDLTLQGYDNDPFVLKVARENAQLAGVDMDIHFQQRDVAQLSTSQKYGVLITNPPWGERIADQEVAEDLTITLTKQTSTWDTWSIYVLSALRHFERLFGQKADRRRKLYMGRIECTYYQYLGPKPPLKKVIATSEETSSSMTDSVENATPEQTSGDVE